MQSEINRCIVRLVVILIWLLCVQLSDVNEVQKTQNLALGKSIGLPACVHQIFD